ncbi:MAG: N-acetylmuramoyl-L-alanine amidase, partial [Eubacteriales bacterium]|nr:N-acetylmuramoyl-L-alanine amidase [Eubacteriales bacterium]
MTQKRALKLSVIIVFVSLGLLLTTALFRKIWPQLTTAYSMEADARKSERSDQLPLNELAEDKLSLNAYKVLAWPEESAVPDYHSSDMTLYYNRNKNAEALKGILVFIDPARGGKDSGYFLRSSTPEGELTDLFSAAELNLKLAEKTKSKLEALGAEVILMRSSNLEMGEKERAARLAHYLLSDFIQELSEREFKSDRLSDLRQRLGNLISAKDEKALGEIFTAQGVGPDLRLILDLEAQYSEMFYLRIDHAANTADSNQRGFQIEILNQAAVAANAGPETPAYMGYKTQEAAELAENLAAELLALIPELKAGDREMVKSGAREFQRFINLSMIDFSPGYLTNTRDLSILLVPERQEIIAEALANALYKQLSTAPP